MDSTMTTEAPALPEPFEPEPPAPPPEPLRPVSTFERLATIDILRGLALFGILAANIRGFSGPPVAYFNAQAFWPALHDQIAQTFIATFVQGKFITIFAFLFGVGFAMQFDRAVARSGKFGWTWARRQFVLLLFGLTHGLLIWFGDILLDYAIAGFFLLLFRKRRNKTLAVWALICLLVMPLLATSAFVAMRLGVKIPRPPRQTAEIAKAADVYENGTWLEVQSYRAKDAVRYNWAFFPVLFWNIQGLFLLGMLAWRKGFFRPSPESLPRYRTVMKWALFVGVTGNVAMAVIIRILGPSPSPTTWLGFATVPLRVIAVPALSLGYMCVVILLCHDPAWRARLRRFGAVGRTALTNYLLQSVLGTLIFYGYGLGFFGIGPLGLLPLTVVIFTAQLFASAWWLERYRYGPVEWLWRRLTYRGALPMRREKLLPAAEPATPPVSDAPEAG
jgi:uncharacterized protein